jgi:DNA repair ATPase RecN
MGEVSNELLAKQMQTGFAEIKTELAAVRADLTATKTNLAAVAGTLVTVQRDINAGQRELTGLNNRMGVLVVTTDDHAHQLADIKTRLEQIEKKLNLTHA